MAITAKTMYEMNGKSYDCYALYDAVCGNLDGLLSDLVQLVSLDLTEQEREDVTSWVYFNAEILHRALGDFIEARELV